jgi:hypothetical protein
MSRLFSEGTKPVIFPSKIAKRTGGFGIDWRTAVARRAGMSGVQWRQAIVKLTGTTDPIDWAKAVRKSEAVDDWQQGIASLVSNEPTK